MKNKKLKKTIKSLACCDGLCDQPPIVIGATTGTLYCKNHYEEIVIKLDLEPVIKIT